MLELHHRQSCNTAGVQSSCRHEEMKRRHTGLLQRAYLANHKNTLRLIAETRIIHSYKNNSNWRDSRDWFLSLSNKRCVRHHGHRTA